MEDRGVLMQQVLYKIFETILIYGIFYYFASKIYAYRRCEQEIYNTNMADSLKTTIYGGLIFFLLIAGYSILSWFTQNLWVDAAVYFVAPTLASSFFIISKFVSLRRKGSLSIRPIIRVILTTIGIFVCLFFLGIIVDIMVDSEIFFLFNPSLLSILFVVLKVSEKSWLYAGLSQFLGSFIVLFVFIVFFRPTGEAGMAVLMLLTYAFIGFCLGAFIGFLKDRIYIWTRRSP